MSSRWTIALSAPPIETISEQVNPLRRPKANQLGRPATELHEAWLQAFGTRWCLKTHSSILARTHSTKLSLLSLTRLIS